MVVFTGDRAKLSHDARAAHDAWLAAGGESAPSCRSAGRLGGGRVVRHRSRARRDRPLRATGGMDQPPACPGIGLGHPERTCTATPGACSAVRWRPSTRSPSSRSSPACSRWTGRTMRARYTSAISTWTSRLPRPPLGRVVGSDVLKAPFAPRRRNSHKGTYGNVGIVGGAPGMAGAALLAGRAALQLGAGRVYVGMLDAEAPRVDFGQPEVMLRAADEVLALDHLTCLVVGPGLSRRPRRAAPWPWRSSARCRSCSTPTR